MTQMELVKVNGRWPLLLPAHRAARPEWPWWEATRLAAMRSVIGPDSVVLDVGAEEGDFPALYATWGATVMMAEPNPRVWPNIAAIWKANHLEPPLWTWPGFLGAPEDDRGATQPTWFVRTWPEQANGEVIGDHGFCQLYERPDRPSVTVDDVVLKVAAPTVITMDVEGSELRVLEGAARTLELTMPDVFVSIHPEFMAEHYATPDGVQVVRDFMADHQYPYESHRFLAIDHEHHWWFPRSEVYR